MKCIAKTSRWGVKPCPNNAKCDGYCYAHHPSVVLAKLELEQRAGRKYARDYMLSGEVSITSEIERQKRILKYLEPELGASL